MVVLLADEIKALCEGSDPMISPFRPSQLRPASYQLLLGRDAHIGGEDKRVDIDREIVIEPHQVAVVSTYETIKIPRDMIARWSIRVTNIYEGLLWTGGLQVDPGWEGPLFCPIYNLAERTVVLKYRDALFTMDFVRTTPVKKRLKDIKEEYPKVWFTPQRRTLAEHDQHRLHSAPYEALRELKELQRFRQFGYAAVGMMFAILAIMVAALAVVAVEPTVAPDGPLLSFWPMTALVFSITSLLTSFTTVMFGCNLWKKLRKFLSRTKDVA